MIRCVCSASAPATGETPCRLPAATSVPVRATLVELDPDLAATARTTARELRLDVDVRCADAGTTGAYRGVLPVDVLLLCGIFGDVTDADIATTLVARARPMLFRFV